MRIDALPGLLQRLWGRRVSYLIFHVTSRCNAACEHCFNWRNTQLSGGKGEDELTLSEIEQIVRKLPPMLLVNLCGGEPFMREDLADIVALFREHTGVKYVTIPTNAFLPDRTVDQLERIFRENPDVFFRLGVSLDGWEEEHDRIRRHRNGFAKVIETVTRLKELKKEHTNFFVEANIVFSKNTQDGVDDLAAKIKSLGLFDSIAILFIRGRPQDLELLDIDLELYRESSRKLIEAFRVRRHPAHRILEAMTAITVDTIVETKEKEKSCFRCLAAGKFAVINARGEVYPCELLEDQMLGNIREYDYDLCRILKTRKARELKKKEIKKCFCTWECAINMSLVYDPIQSLRVFGRALRSYFKS